MEVASSLMLQIQSLPSEPGVYQYFDADDKILYVGKAKNLKKRVVSYFNKVHDVAKTNVLVKKIVTIKHIVVPTETDALLLENNLIKRLQPRYNVLLKDDKSYPWICIKREPFPRVFMTRTLIKDGSEYFGPYTNIKTVQTLLELIKELYPLRTCNYDLSLSNIQSEKFKVCLEYHIGNCGGACEGFEKETNYDQKIREIRDILKGNFKESLKGFRQHMQMLAEELQFEEAQDVKDKISLLENYQAKSTIVNPKINSVDVFSIISDETSGYINFLQVSYGSIIRSHTLELKKKLDETDRELLEIAIVELRERFSLTSREIIVPFKVTASEGITLTIPKMGDKKKLLELSERNAKFYRIDQFKQMKIVDPDRHVKRIMAQMQKDLRLNKEPRHIECFDNSNIQGTNPVAACVVFKNGKPSKKDYRHFNIKTVEGPNDYDSMAEIVYRRYKRILEEGSDLPDLIVVDGGKGQLGMALKSLEQLELRGKVAVISLAERLEEIYYPGDQYPLYLDKRSETMKIIIQLRDEAHRFGLTFHRNQRSKNAITSVLDDIKGVGGKTKETLMRSFKSISKIREASEEELQSVVGKAKGSLVYEFLKKNN